MPTIPSNTSHARRLPAIYRWFISKSPPGFVEVISLARNFFDHSKRHIGGSSASFPGSQPPPTPFLDVSNQPINYGSPMTNSFDLVGSRAASFRSVLQSHNACFAARKYFHRNICGFTCSILFIGVIKNFPFGLLLLHVGFFQSVFDLFEWHPFFHAHNIVQLRINYNLLVTRQFNASCFAINHPTEHLFSHCPLTFA